MSRLKGRIVKATAVVLAVTLLHLCANAELVRAASARLIAGVAVQGPIQGRLTTRGNNPVSVNGNSAKSGETIFSGQTIQTPAGVGATVNLPGMGRVDMAPNTNATLSFEAGRISVTLTSGCAILTADKGTVGVLDADGSAQQTDAANGGTLGACTSKTPGGAPVTGQDAATAAGAGADAGTTGAGTAAGGGGLFGLGTAGTVAVIGAAAGGIAAAAILVPCRRGRNPSPGTPRGRNDECR